MINVSFSNKQLTIQKVKKSPPQRKDIEGVDGNVYKINVPGSSKTTVEFTHTHKGALKINELPDDILNNFSEIEHISIMEKQKKAIQKTLAKNIQACLKQLDSILDYKDFIEGGQDAEILGTKLKELQGALKKK